MNSPSFEVSLKGSNTETFAALIVCLVGWAFLFYLASRSTKEVQMGKKERKEDKGNKEDTCRCKCTCPCFCSGTIIWTQSGMPQEGDWPKRERQRDEIQDNCQLQKDETEARKRPPRTSGSRDPSSLLQNPDAKPGPSGTTTSGTIPEALGPGFTADDEDSAHRGHPSGTASFFN